MGSARQGSNLWLLPISVACVGVGMLFLGLFGRAHWSFELIANLRVQLCGGFIFASAIFAVGRKWEWLWVTGAAALLLAASIAPIFVDPDRTEDTARGAKYRLIFCNVHTANGKRRPLLDLVAQESPDLIVLAEIDSAWVADMGPLRDQYPHHLELPRSDNFGIAMYSRVPFQAIETIDFGAGVPSIWATIKIADTEFDVLGTHPLPPIGADYARRRNEQLHAIRARLRKHNKPLALVGDLNVTPWSPYFRTVRGDWSKGFGAAKPLRDARRGYEILPTWPVGLGPLGIPLDHCLVYRLGIDRFRTGPDIGSDHLPILVDLIVPSGRTSGVPSPGQRGG